MDQFMDQVLGYQPFGFPIILYAIPPLVSFIAVFVLYQIVNIASFPPRKPKFRKKSR